MIAAGGIVLLTGPPRGLMAVKGWPPHCQLPGAAGLAAAADAAVFAATRPDAGLADL